MKMGSPANEYECVVSRLVSTIDPYGVTSDAAIVAFRDWYEQHFDSTPPPAIEVLDVISDAMGRSPVVT